MLLQRSAQGEPKLRRKGKLSREKLGAILTRPKSELPELHYKLKRSRERIIHVVYERELFLADLAPWPAVSKPLANRLCDFLRQKVKAL